MSYQDEFESLIQNFKLDDPEPQPRQVVGAAQQPAAYGAGTSQQRPSQGAYGQASQPRLSQGAYGQASQQRPSQGAYGQASQQRPSQASYRAQAPQQRPSQGAYGGQASQQYPSQGAYGQAPQPQRSYSSQPPLRQTQPPVFEAQMVQNRSSSQNSRRGNFQVRIDDSKFYTQGVVPPRPPRGNEPLPPEPDPDDGDDEDEEEIHDGPLSGLGRWTKALLVLAAALGVSAFLAFFALNSAGDLFGLNKPDKELTFTLPETDSISEVASLLKEKGVITQPLTFQLYATLKKKNEGYIPGTYELNSNMSYDQIMTRLRTVVKEQVEVSVIFYEGMTMREIAERLEKNKVCSAEDFYKFLEQDELPWAFDFLKEIPDKKERYRRLEGYLFPDTYTFTEDEDVSTVVQKFFVNFNNKFDDDLLKKVENSGMTLDEVITMASIIQKEVANDDDMKRVSSVFHNRIASGQMPKLQSDVTVFYVENDLKPFLGGQQGQKAENDPNQYIYDAYNTYACDGLPTGPICNPGMNAIRAALEPAETQYYYFVADKDGKTYYAATQAEHDANVAKVLELGDAHGVGTGIGPQEENETAGQ